MNLGVNSLNNLQGINGYSGTENISPANEKALKHAGVIECETCANRKYKDGSDEANVSFKSPSHVDPSSSASKVMAHEQEHVSNAYAKAGQKNGEVVNCSVTLKTAVCPECGRSYVAGGVTNTAIKYPDNSKFSQNRKSADYSVYAGHNIDAGV
ncbi:MAG: hypothetical protein PUD10_00450 [Lachnospira sp.]|nr:hypothetical protein [Lachnospira sp.]